MELKEIAFIHTGFTQKFGIPRQSGLVLDEIGYIVFTEEFRNPTFIDGITDYDYLWLLWGFSKNKPLEGGTVRPPRLGGEKHMGVFATRAPYRPNNIGLSSVKLIEVKQTEKEGPVLVVSGVDMLDGTPIYDIKPYIPYADAHPEARGGFTDSLSKGVQVKVEFPEALLAKLPQDLRQSAIDVLSQDPRAGYDRGKNRDFRLAYHGYDIVFESVNDSLIVKEVIKIL
ncbi:MAG: tRNA (N6-threonylcarbamoyladenosine(37)-N6)-methyltransferase TrmO [Pseudobutyrivibrio ruminis]|uniref:tRNA (N6-threonylcarbamoyladenosine(37)-N6)-methyltransferase TrmO n=1 Tax=Pseudobutyrivibrio ruminis TaxID=46206 RepID=UPI0026F30B4F|nr:tRNA (N6-threonylcarbamoyladenosine(37)-N6)-methyltransferase TrmO [Pseudobutyrivibrio ruminis]MBE5913275.1 tRNA (N6-threonylcarbamoyladenosine(37)-N6)-methyltransferase TrmO [Pseudobutyrivibrio ruminis]